MVEVASLELAKMVPVGVKTSVGPAKMVSLGPIGVAKMASLELDKVTLELLKTVSVELDKTSSVELAKMASVELGKATSVGRAIGELDIGLVSLVLGKEVVDGVATSKLSV